MFFGGASSSSARLVRPEPLYGRWMVSWCHRRAAAREFPVSGIEAVSVPGPANDPPLQFGIVWQFIANGALVSATDCVPVSVD